MSQPAVVSPITYLTALVVSMFSTLSADADDNRPLILRGELCHVDSADGRMRVTLTEWDGAGTSDSDGARGSAELRWRVDRLVDGRVSDNLLPNATLTRHPARRHATIARLREDRYQAVHGKRKACGGSFRETTIHNDQGDGGREVQEITLRVYDDGVACRYKTPSRSGVKAEPAPWTFAAAPGTKAWIAPYDRSGEWTPAYEVYYEAGIAAGAESPHAEGWAFPALFELPGKKGWALVTESAVPHDYCGTRFAAKPIRTADGAHYKLRFPNRRPGEYVILARREAQSWYIAGINGKDEPLEVSVDLTPLGDSVASEANLGNATVTFITDGEGDESWRISNRLTTQIRLLPRGGFVLLIDK